MVIVKKYLKEDPVTRNSRKLMWRVTSKEDLQGFSKKYVAWALKANKH